MNFILDLIRKIFHVIKTGTFSVVNGTHEVVVPLVLTGNEQVWVQIQSQFASGCGTATVNEVGYSVSTTGVTFYVNCTSESCTVNWIVE